jgi:hypothetical protein
MAQQRQCAKYDACKRAILPRGECVGWWIGRRLDGGKREVVVVGQYEMKQPVGR